MEHAITYLTNPLVAAHIYPIHTIDALFNALNANLAPSASRRILSFVPGALPPRPIYKACVNANVDWSLWSRLLGDYEFDLIIDSTSVAVRLPAAHPHPARLITIWSDANANANPLQQRQAAPQTTNRKTPAQLLIEADADDDDALFSALAAELHAPAWRTPVAELFPDSVVRMPQLALQGHKQTEGQGQLRVPRRPSMHSRSSSRSSVVSAAPSFISDDASVSSCASLSSLASATSSTSSTSSSRSSSTSSSGRRARAPRVFIDTSKNEVTPYDGGKTTVLTGGVMLGAAPPRGSRAAAGRRTPRF